MVGRTRKVVNAVHRIVTLLNFLTCLATSKSKPILKFNSWSSSHSSPVINSVSLVPLLFMLF